MKPSPRSLLVPLVLATLLATLLAPARAAQEVRPEERREVALAYVQDLARGAFESAGRHLTADAVYEDPTAEAVSGRPRRFEGRSAILSSFQRARIGATTTEVEIEEAFDSGDDLVLLLRYRSQGSAGVIGRETTQVASSFRALTLLTFRGARIARHRDHVDYRTMLRGLGATDAASETSATRAVAERYLGALLAGDLDAAASLLAPDAVLDVRGPDGTGRRLEGRDAVLAGIRAGSPVAGSSAIRDGFDAGELAVLVLVAEASTERAPGTPGPATAVVVLHVRDGTVLEHVGRDRSTTRRSG